MGINSKINNLIKEFLYIIYSETYHNKSNNTFIERYVAKHPLLKPELIVINDQIQGFKNVSKKVTSLEEFPIYLEIEGMYEDENIYLIESIDLYSETSINCQSRLTDIIYVTNLFNNFLSFERTIDVSTPKEESIIITSKIQDYLIIKSESDTLKSLNYSDSSNEEEEDDIKDIVINIDQFNNILRLHLRFFVEFIKICHDILIKDISLLKMKSNIEAFLEENA
ncbi:hypothetical protein CL658_02220 [bacterium]|nr:hypothetical protein [bacterium]|tara:strand:- start:833 stop:1504 length:672 start_codon:yes stop_codon:yes gene_type:complete